MPGAIRYRRSPEEVGSGVNDNRKKLEKLVTDKSYNRLVVGHKDRLTRFSLQLPEDAGRRAGKDNRDC
ncbi:MAG: hypothetical protein KJ602_02170, partial [Actinobacteria bacterium]|nr:hypothetical protein [Actinomycetota bacterium]